MGLARKRKGRESFSDQMKKSDNAKVRQKKKKLSSQVSADSVEDALVVKEGSYSDDSNHQDGSAKLCDTTEALNDLFADQEDEGHLSLPASGTINKSSSFKTGEHVPEVEGADTVEVLVSEENDDYGSDELCPTFQKESARPSTDTTNELEINKRVEEQTSTVGQKITGKEERTNNHLQRAHISSIVKELKEEISLKLEATYAPLVSQISLMSNEISGLKDMVKTLLVSKTLTVSGGARVSLNSKCDYELINFAICFNEKVLLRVVKSAFVRFLAIQTVRQKKGGADLISNNNSSYCLAFRSVLYGKRANQARVSWKEGVGIDASNFRKMIVLSTLINVQRNRFNQFEDGVNIGMSAASSDHRSQDSASKNHQKCLSGHSQKIIAPSWLLDVNSKHVEKIREMKETKTALKGKIQTGRKVGESMKPNKEDISLRASERLFCDITNLLHDSRSRAKTILFEEIGYCLTSWLSPQIKTMKDIERPIISWLYPSSSDRYISISNIPLTNVGEYSNDLKINEDIYKGFLNKCEHMVLSIQHDVFVNSGKDISGNKPGIGSMDDNNPESSSAEFEKNYGGGDYEIINRRKLNRVVNLVDISLNFITAYCGVSLKEEINVRLGVHDMIIRACYKIALVLREIVESYLKNCSDLDGGLIECEKEWERKIGYSGLTLADLKSPPSFQLKSILKMVCSVSADNFEALNVCGDENDCDVENEGSMENDGNDDDEIDRNGTLQYVLI